MDYRMTFPVEQTQITPRCPIMIYTIGHSTRPIQELISLLKEHTISILIDVRTVPRSRTNPQFNKDTLPASLASTGIEYRHMAGLGGLRHALRDSLNTAWENAAFRGYADYMLTDEFQQNLDELISVGENNIIAIMCAEAVWWRCHRRLIADALLARGIPVRHITSPTKTEEHKLTPWARVEHNKVCYPGLI